MAVATSPSKGVVLTVYIRATTSFICAKIYSWKTHKTQTFAPAVKSTAKLKKELDRVFSKWIRQKFPKFCYTCRQPNDKLQCGHFVPRQYLATRWSEDNCRPQCWGCNGFGGGKLLDFEEHLIEELGKKKVEALKQSRHQILKLDEAWYLTEIEKYTRLLK